MPAALDWESDRPTSVMKTSVSDSDFQAKIRQIFHAQARLAVLIRYAYRAGGRDFYLLSRLESLEELIGGCKERDLVTVFATVRIIAEGVVDDDFAAALEARLNAGEKWMLIGGDNGDGTPEWDFAETEEELRGGLDSRVGMAVSIIEEPDWVTEGLSVSAYIPDRDGIVRPGAY